MNFDASFEVELLSRALRDQGFLKRAAPILDAHHFGNAHHSWAWRTIKSIWDKYREQPTARLILARAKSDFKKDDELQLHLQLIKKIAKHKPKASSAALDELSKFVRAVNAQLVLEEAAKELEAGNVDKAWTALNAASRKDIKPQDYVNISWIEDFETRQAERKYRSEHPESIISIPTGFKQFDSILSGGIEIGEFGLIMATTGRGKSITLANLAYSAAARGFRTVYFTLEMPAKQIAQRLDSRWSELEYIKFKEWGFKPSELKAIKSRLKRDYKRFKGMVEIIEVPLRACDIGTLRRGLEDLESDKNFVPQLIVVDSADHMNASRRYESHRLEQSAVYWDLSGLAGEGYAVWSSTHAGREYENKVAKTAAVSESYDKARIADIVASINSPERKDRTTKVTMDDEDEEVTVEVTPSSAVTGQRLELFLAKYRDGKSQVTIPLEAHFERMYLKEAEEK